MPGFDNPRVGLPVGVWRQRGESRLTASNNIDVTGEILKLKELLRGAADSEQWKEALSILARWQHDTMLTEESRPVAADLVLEFRR